MYCFQTIHPFLLFFHIIAYHRDRFPLPHYGQIPHFLKMARFIGLLNQVILETFSEETLGILKVTYIQIRGRED